jgi:opacity protein-like surface antigen
MKSIELKILIIVITFPFIAEAGDKGYLFLRGGLTDPIVEIKAPSRYGTIITETGIGSYFGAGIGYRIMENLRLEGEVGYRSNEINDARVIDSSLIVGSEVKGGDGNVTSWSFLVNIRYDLLFAGRWSMHLGGGIGAARISLRDFSLLISPVVPDPQTWKLLLSNDSDWEFAYQACIGIAFQLSTRFIFDLDYTNFATAGPEFITVDGTKFGEEHRSSNYQLSIRYFFF